MLRKLLGVIGLLFAVGCCCVGERKEKVQVEEEKSDYRQIAKWRRGGNWSEEIPKVVTPEKIHSGIGP